jgi:hypothetical protein
MVKGLSRMRGQPSRPVLRGLVSGNTHRLPGGYHHRRLEYRQMVELVGLTQLTSGKPRMQEDGTCSPVGVEGIGRGAPKSLPFPRAFLALPVSLFGSIRFTSRQAVLHVCSSFASSPGP